MPNLQTNLAFISDFMIIPFILTFVMVILVFVIIFGRIFTQWRSNNKSPRLSVEAKIIAKRTHIGGSIRSASVHASAYTSYYATFEVESGDRMELSIPINEFGLLIEGDNGILTFQGSRYISFDRK